MNINLNSPFHLTKLVLREMQVILLASFFLNFLFLRLYNQEKGYGRIVNISSVHGIVASTLLLIFLLVTCRCQQSSLRRHKARSQWIH